MVDKKIQTAIEESQNLSVQSVPLGSDGMGGNIYLVSRLARAGETIYPWWSTMRDQQLRAFWKSVDYLAGAVYSMTSKMSAIPIQVVARDQSNRAHVREAQETTDVLIATAGKGKGWVSEYSKFAEELTTQDNGVFVEIVGNGPPTGGIVGKPVSWNVLDSERCQRTGNSLWPAIYTDDYGGRHKMHFGRLFAQAQMESPDTFMMGVGFSSISRCVNVSQTLLDILVYKQEKLGSRPHRQIVITQGGLDPRDLQSAFTAAENAMDSQNLSRYSKVVIGGSQTVPQAAVQVVELSSMPDGFDENTSVTFGMAAIALAFGTDARELFPAMSAGATRADALLQHLKQRGKGPGQILAMTENFFNLWYLPSHLKFQADFQDDAQDRQSAEIKMVRANRRVQEASTGTIDLRVMREQMVDDNDITRSQFDYLELEDGRLPNGNPVTTLFWDKSGKFTKYLDLGVENPMDKCNNDPIYMQDAIMDKRAEVADTLANTKSEVERWIALQADAALTECELLYVPASPIIPGEAVTSVGTPTADEKKPEDEQGRESPSNRGNLRSLPGKQYVDPRNRKIDLTSVGNAQQSFGEALSINPGEEK